MTSRTTRRSNRRYRERLMGRDITDEFIACKAITAGTLVMLTGKDDTTVAKCTPTGRILGVATETKTNGQKIKVQIDGLCSVGTC